MSRYISSSLPKNRRCFFNIVRSQGCMFCIFRTKLSLANKIASLYILYINLPTEVFDNNLVPCHSFVGSVPFLSSSWISTYKSAARSLFQSRRTTCTTRKGANVLSALTKSLRGGATKYRVYGKRLKGQCIAA